MNGTGKLLVLAVGVNSVQGSILQTVGASDEVVHVDGAGTLVEKLDEFALLIGKFGSVRRVSRYSSFYINDCLGSCSSDSHYHGFEMVCTRICLERCVRWKEPSCV